MQSHYRVSSYTIYVPLPEDPLSIILIHAYTGAMDKVRKHIARFLQSNPILAETDLSKAPLREQTIRYLITRGYLTHKLPSEEKQDVAHLADLFHKRSRVSSFLFLVAYNCNFRCPYCFENDISSKGKAWSKKVFTKELVARAYDAMMEIQSDKKLQLRTITLYGGEPLLKENYEIVEFIISQGKARDFAFKAITNGYDLDSFESLLGPGLIAFIQVTIDGKPDSHDKRRTHFQDGKTFNRILSNIHIALQKKVKISVRVNTDGTNFEDLNDLTMLFKEQGFFKQKNFSMYSALVHSEESQIQCNTVMTSSVENHQSSPIQTSIPVAAQQPRATTLPLEATTDQYINFEREEERFLDMTKKQSFSTSEIKPFMESPDYLDLMKRGEFVEKFLSSIDLNPDLANVSCQDFGIQNAIKSLLADDGIPSWKPTFCSAQAGMIVFDPYGDLYTCWELVGMEQYKVGVFSEKLQLEGETLSKWFDKNISNVVACSKCKYALFCGGGCQAHALRDGRGYGSSYCDGFPKVFQTIVPRIVKEHQNKKVN